MSDEKQQWAVYLDYGVAVEWDAAGRPVDSLLNTVVLGGSIDDRGWVGRYLYTLKWGGNLDEAGDLDIWEVDEDDLPYGYTFQTYYVAPYYGADIEKGVTA